ncbi:hypothetical protein SPAN111604_14810 [Sphingomonas antarctica]
MRSAGVGDRSLAASAPTATPVVVPRCQMPFMGPVETGLNARVRTPLRASFPYLGKACPRVARRQFLEQYYEIIRTNRQGLAIVVDYLGVIARGKENPGLAWDRVQYRMRAVGIRQSNAAIICLAGSVRANALNVKRGALAPPNAPPTPTSIAIPLLQLVARDHPPGGDDVRPLPAVAAERRGPAGRAWDRHLP